MSFINSYSNFFRKYFPSPFSIAIILSFVSFLLALFITKNNESFIAYIPKLGTYWFEGMFKDGLLAFTIHMMLILVLGHVLALTKTAQKLIDFSLKYATNTANAAYLVCLLTIIVALFNWGLGLIFGAIFARKIAEKFQKENKKLNYPLIAAAAYVGLMVWHGGLSGSSLLKINEEGHLQSLTNTISETIPVSISISETIFSSMNIIVGFTLLVGLSLTAYLMGKRTKPKGYTISMFKEVSTEDDNPEGMEKLTYSKWFGRIIGFLMIVYLCIKIIDYTGVFLGFVNPNFINLSLLALALSLHKSIFKFLDSIENAIGGAAGILIQFPLYFGIMGIMMESNLVSQFSQFLISFSTETTYPIFTFLSAAIVNVFVPSGGGQWAIQGPIIVDSFLQSNIPLEKSILAMAYGDELTNMLQPFWALPLLGITGLKAKEIIPYTLIFLLVAAVIFITALLIF